MDAAVWNPQMMMMTDLDCNSNLVNAELEVKKLQELVRKLEKQNEQLRTRANAVNCTGSPHILPPSPACILGNTLGPGGYCLPSPLSTILRQTSLGSFCPADEPFEYFHPHSADAEEGEPTVLDEVEVLDLDSIFPFEESDDSWLYVSSKARPWGDDPPLSSLQWCRQVLDSLRGEVEAARRSMCLRLDQVSRWRGGFSNTSSPAPSLSRVAGVSPLSASNTKSCSTPTSSDRPASFSPSLHPLLHLPLSPVGKGPSAPTERTPTFLPHPASRGHSLRQSALSPQSSMDSELSASELEDDSIALSYKLQDLTDVQVMARLQEESLRQDYATTSASIVNRRSASFSFQFGHRSGEPDLEEEEEEEEDYGQLPPPQPRLTRAGPFQRGLPHSQTFSSMRDWRRSTSTPTKPGTPPNPAAGIFLPQASPASSPTSSPYMSRQQGLRTGSAEYENKLRRSMPNLVRAPSMPSMPSVPSPANHFGSPSLLRNSQSFDSSNGLARLQSSIPAPGQLQHRVQSVGNFQALSRQPLKATAYVSPTIKGSVSMPASTSLQSLSGGGNSGIPLSSKPSPANSRSSLPRPASFIGTSSTPRSKIAQPARSLLTPPKSLSTLSALRDGSWRDGCY